jgi:ABC-type multidrug transport system ATPase subunit
MEPIALHQLSKSYGSVTAVQDLSLTLNPGRVTG